MEQDQKTVQLPAPTAWPIVLALGATLLFAGLLTGVDITVVGAVLTVVAAVGWFRDVLPREHHEMAPVESEEAPIATARTEVTRPAPETHRLRIPVEIYPVTAGIKGGLAGSVAMAVLGCAYGVLSHGSIWYPINLLASVVDAESLRLPMDYLTSFHLALFLVASFLHVVTSILVGLLYGVMLPMFPRTADFAGRPDCSHHVVRPAVCHARHHQSAVGPEDRLEMVRGFADGLRHRSRTGGGEAGARSHPSVPAVRRARGD